MTPKTQSVCKYCQQPIKLYVGVWIEVGKECAGVYCAIHRDATQQHGTGFHIPVAEPASTGEPQSCPCPCHKGESVICNCGGGFECEYINSIPAARPSEPSACNWPFEGRCTQKEACIQANRCLKSLPSAPHTSADHNCPECGRWHSILKPVFSAPPTFECAARKAGTTGGNYPQDCDWPFCGCDPKAEKVISTLLECGWNPPQRAQAAAPQPVSGDAPKVEEIAHKLHLYHCQERRSGSICPCHVVAEGMTEGCHCKEETADIASILRRYFPPASQTPRDSVKWLEDMGYGVNTGEATFHCQHGKCMQCEGCSRCGAEIDHFRSHK